MYRILYRCDIDQIMDKNRKNENFRECINGSWTGEISQCGEFRVFQLFVGHELRPFFQLKLQK